MRHIPNLFTLLNLFFGCLAIVFILQTGEGIVNRDGEEWKVYLPERIWWGSVCIALAAVVAFVALVMREKGIVSRRLVRAELLGLIGGVVALVIMARVSSSGFTDAGGPADWFLIALVYGVGAVATVILAYAVMGWMRPRQAAR